MGNWTMTFHKSVWFRTQRLRLWLCSVRPNLGTGIKHADSSEILPTNCRERVVILKVKLLQSSLKVVSYW